MAKKSVILLIVLAVLVALFMQFKNKGASNLESAVKDLTELGSGTTDPLSFDLINYIPVNTHSLGICDFASSSGKALYQSIEYAKILELVGKADQVFAALKTGTPSSSNDQLDMIVKLIQAVKESGYSWQPEKCPKMVYFQTEAGNSLMPIAGAFGQCEGAFGVDLLVSAIKKAGLQVSEIEQSGIKLYGVRSSLCA